MKKYLLVIGFLILLTSEILKVYLIMPFPGSQKANTIDFAFFLHKNILYLRLIGVFLIAYGIKGRFRRWTRGQQGLLIGVSFLYLLIFLVGNFLFLADKLFYQPRIKNFATESNNKVPRDKLVLGVERNGVAKAYPIEIIGYHHQVKDTVGGVPVIVTYCSICRTGRVFSPFVKSRYEEFRLVGMDHFNAIFEDKSTGSWWQQATGEAIAGPLKGTMLHEIPSSQSSLQSWLEKYPTSRILQPDSNFKQDYKGLVGYDKGTIKSSLEKRDSGSWRFKSWVVGISYKNFAKAYDWNDLMNLRVINDSLPYQPILLALEPDSVSFHVWSRMVHGQSLLFETGTDLHILYDRQTHSRWNFHGICEQGTLKDQRLLPLQSYQEFWHSWRTFHPATARYTLQNSKYQTGYKQN